MNSVVSAPTISGESVTCIAVKEDRHQITVSSVALKKGVEEPWTIERVAEFIDFLGYREITLKSDTKPESLLSETLWHKCAKQELHQRMQLKETSQRTGSSWTL